MCGSAAWARSTPTDRQSQNDVDAGLVSLTKAAALAMAIAIGVNLGSELFRLFLPGAARAGRKAAKRTRGF